MPSAWARLWARDPGQDRRNKERRVGVALNGGWSVGRPGLNTLSLLPPPADRAASPPLSKTSLKGSLSTCTAQLSSLHPGRSFNPSSTQNQGIPCQSLSRIKPHPPGTRTAIYSSSPYPLHPIQPLKKQSRLRSAATVNGIIQITGRLICFQDQQNRTNGTPEIMSATR